MAPISTTRLLPLVVVACLVRFGPAIAAPPPGEDWVPTFAEEFNGSSLDPADWSIGTKAGKGTQPYREAAQTVLSDGALHLVTRHHDKGRREWTTSEVSTRVFRQTYGYYEARMRYARSTGLSNAFRLLSDRSLRAGGIEILVNEGAYPYRITMELRRRDSSVGSVRMALAGFDLSADYHVYGLKWEPDAGGGSMLTWYVDDHPVHSARCADCTLPVRLQFDTSVTTWAGPFAPTLDGASMDVDYVRVYQFRSLTDRSALLTPRESPP